MFRNLYTVKQRKKREESIDQLNFDFMGPSYNHHFSNFEDIITGLEEDEKSMIRDRFIKNKTIVEIWKESGLSTKSGNFKNKFTRIIAKLREQHPENF